MIILLIPNVAGYISYRAAIAAAEAGSIETSMVMLNKSKELFEQRMNEVESFATRIARNQDLSILLSDKVNEGDYHIFELTKLWRDINSYTSMNDFLQNYYIYLRNYNTVLTRSSSSISLRPEFYYNKYFYKDISFEQWKETILEKVHQHRIIPLRPYSDNGKETSRISYVQSIPLNSFNQSLGTIVVTIDQNEISSLLESVSTQYGGWANIADSQGNTLASVGIGESQVKELQLSAQAMEGNVSKRYVDNTLLISVRSDSNGWLYTAGIPRQAIMKQADAIKKNTWVVTAATFLLGLILSFLLAYRNSAPIDKLIGMITEQVSLNSSKKINGYHFLHGNISGIISNNKKLESELHRQAPLLQDAFLKRLVRGEFGSLNEIKATASLTGNDLKGEFGYVGIVQINGYSGMDSKDVLNELHAARMIIKQTLLGLDSGIWMIDMDSDKIVVIFIYGKEPDASAEREIETIMNDLRTAVEAEYRIRLTVSMGALFQTLADISRSYFEARRTMEHAAFMDGRGMLWHRDMPKETAAYYYPVDLELRLLNALKLGDSSEVKRMMAVIFENNFMERELSAEMAQQLVGEIKGTIFKQFDQKREMETHVVEKLKKQALHIQLTDGLEQAWNELEAVMDAFCSLIIQEKNDRDYETVLALIKHLEEMYADPDLTVFHIAEKSGLPEKVISQLFKEQAGQSVSEYLEQIRINKANGLLVESGMTIDEIACHVGYNSSHSFRRAFKRVTGVSPSMYRNKTE